MKDSESPVNIKWWNTKYFIRAAFVFVILLAVLLVLVERATPPEGFVFERHPTLIGIYKCCEAGGRYSRSWVGEIGVNCGPISYFEFLGTNRNDCGLKEQITGRLVEVERTVIPTLGERSPLVREIRYSNQILYQLSDEELKRLWLSNSRSGAFSIAIIISIWVYGLQMILAGLKNKGLGRKS